MRAGVIALTDNTHIRSYSESTMNLFRAIPIHVHGALEVAAAPLLLIAPFVLGFGAVAGTLSFALGVILIGLALTVDGGKGERGALPLRAHAGFDLVLASITIALGVALAITGDAVAAIFLVGFGSAHMALTASTRYSRPLGA
jgi:hypothetical protein